MKADVLKAAQKLAAGEVVGLPTETVYGLAADAENPSAVAQIFAVKNRPANHPLITHIAADADLTHWVDAARMSDEVWRLTHALMAAFSPGPLTLVLPKHPNIDSIVTGGQDTIALRSPNHEIFQDVLHEFARIKGTPHVGIAAPSANRFGRVSPTRAAHVRDEFDGAVWVLDGDEAVIGIESTIVDLTTGVPLVLPHVLRLGHITPDDIARVCGVEPILPQHAKNTPRVSGSLLAHYAPATPLMWARVGRERGQTHAACLYYSDDFAHGDYARRLKLPDEPHEYARGLYHALREMDTWGVAAIAVEDLPASRSWDAVRDRLGRAIVGSNANMDE